VPTGGAEGSASAERLSDAVGGRATDTRTRILDAAVSLFGEYGYAGTSVRDIAERLGLTKAALYYHFPSKETILDALLDPFVTELTRIVELVRSPSPPCPRATVELMAGLLAGPGSVLSALVNDPSVLHRKIGEEDVFSLSEEVIRAIAGPNPTADALLRARCALGAVQSGILGAAFGRRHAGGRGAAGTGTPGCGKGAGGTAQGGGATQAGGTAQVAGTAQVGAVSAVAGEDNLVSAVSWPPRPIITDEVRSVIVDAAMAALDSGQIPAPSTQSMASAPPLAQCWSPDAGPR